MVGNSDDLESPLMIILMMDFLYLNGTNKAVHFTVGRV